MEMLNVFSTVLSKLVTEMGIVTLSRKLRNRLEILWRPISIIKSKPKEKISKKITTKKHTLVERFVGNKSGRNDRGSSTGKRENSAGCCKAGGILCRYIHSHLVQINV